MADEDEDITIDLRLRDYLTGGAAAAAREMEELADSTKKAARALLLLDKRADKATTTLLKLAAAAKAASGSMDDFTAGVDKSSASMQKQIQTQTNLNKSMNRVQSGMKKTTDANNRMRKSFQLLQGTMKTVISGMFMLSKVMALVGGAAVAGTLVQQLLAVAGALSTMASFAALLPVLLGGIAAAVATGIVAFKGLGAELKEQYGDVFDLFKDLKKEVQNEFLKTLTDSVPNAMRNLQPVIRTGMKGIAREFGLLTNQVGQFFSTQAGKKMFGQFFIAGNDIVRVLRKNIKPLLEGFGKIIDAAMPAWERFIGASDKALGKFSNWMKEISENGQLEEWLDTAFQVAKALGSVLGEIGGIIKGIVNAAGGAGAGTSALGGLGVALGEINKWVNSFEGQTALASFFESIGRIATALAPVLKVIANTIGTVLAPALATIVESIAPGATIFFQALSDAFAVIEPHIGTLAEGFGQLFIALAPLLGPLGQLAAILVEYIGQALQILAPIIGIVAQAFSSFLTPVLEATMQILEAFAPYIPVISQALADMGAMLAPIFAEMGQVFATAVIPYIDELMAMLPQLMPLIMELIYSFGIYFVQALQTLMPYVPMLAQFLVFLMQAAVRLLPYILQLGIWLIQAAAATWPIIAAIGRVIVVVWNFGNRVFETTNRIIGFIARIVNGFVGMPGRISRAVAGIASALARPFQEGYNRVRGWIDRIRSAIANFNPGRLAAGALDAINPFRFAGGPVEGGKQYTVGEIGKEMFVGNNGQTKIIGANGMDPNWTAPGAGTIIPNSMLRTFDAVQNALEAAAVATEQKSLTTRDLAALAAASKSEEHHHYTVPVTIMGNVTENVDIERAVSKVLKKVERDREERR